MSRASVPIGAPTANSVVTAAPDARGRTVLLIEDDEQHRFVYARMLETGGYTVAQARTGPGGLEAAVQLHPDAIVIDIGLPGMDGWEVTRRLKASDATRAIPVIAVTVHTYPGDKETSIAAGCAAHLDKPALPTTVLAAVDEVLGVQRAPLDD